MAATATESDGRTFGPSGPDMNSNPQFEASVAYGEEKTEAFLEGARRAKIARVVRALGAAAITIALMIVVLNEIFTLSIVNNSEGPFSVDTIQGPMAGALGLLSLGILVGGARVVMGQMGGGSGGL